MDNTRDMRNLLEENGYTFQQIGDATFGVFDPDGHLLQIYRNAHHDKSAVETALRHYNRMDARTHG